MKQTKVIITPEAKRREGKKKEYKKKRQSNIKYKMSYLYTFQNENRDFKKVARI